MLETGMPIALLTSSKAMAGLPSSRAESSNASPRLPHLTAGSSPITVGLEPRRASMPLPFSGGFGDKVACFLSFPPSI
eukprot:3014415-Rhodomonas_salina.1